MAFEAIASILITMSHEQTKPVLSEGHRQLAELLSNFVREGIKGDFDKVLAPVIGVLAILEEKINALTIKVDEIGKGMLTGPTPTEAAKLRPKVTAIKKAGKPPAEAGAEPSDDAGKVTNKMFYCRFMFSDPDFVARHVTPANSEQLNSEENLAKYAKTKKTGVELDRIKGMLFWKSVADEATKTRIAQEYTDWKASRAAELAPAPLENEK